MVGIVIVSHSSKAAEGAREIALQMAGKNQPVIAAGGTETGEIGTDPIRIQKAVETADQGDGVVVLADLGSTVMSVSLVKEMIDPKLAESVYLANAPLVEGAVAATIEAAMGSPAEKVLQTAEDTRNLDKLL